jgi:hypothetical protein
VLIKLDWFAAILGGFVVVLSGWATLYLPDATFGGVADYFAVGTWGIALGSGVAVARRLLPLPSLG